MLYGPAAESFVVISLSVKCVVYGKEGAVTIERLAVHQYLNPAYKKDLLEYNILWNTLQWPQRL